VRPKGRNTPVALTIAGSDSGGGAGIQADLKTFSALGVFGTSAITCLTAQNPDGVTGIAPTPKGFVGKQIDAVCSAFPVVSAKTGMLFSAAIIREAANALRDASIPSLVVDPVAKATSGSNLLKPSAERALVEDLIPLALVITPNIPEAEMLCGHTISGDTDQIDAARELSKSFATSCLLKGGHMNGSTVVDVLCHKGRVYKVSAPRLQAKETHGTGCTLSAALTAYLACGRTLPDAFKKACAFVHEALKSPFSAGPHFPLGIR
jgi:hydroxymethylpyrimidine kinase/phosphomethylpyrimidine kinase